MMGPPYRLGGGGAICGPAVASTTAFIPLVPADSHQSPAYRHNTAQGPGQGRIATMSAQIVIPPAPPASSQSGAPQTSRDSQFAIPDHIVKGMLMTKVSKNGLKKVMFRIDPDEGQICYKSRKNGLVPIETIKELRSGADARYYRIQFSQPEECESRWITIIYILGGEYKTLHVLADTKEHFEAWEGALRKLYSVRQGLTAGLGDLEMREAIWERQYWKGADSAGDQILDSDDVNRLCKRLNANLHTAQIKALFKAADTENLGHLDFAGFRRFVKKLKARPEIESLYGRIASDNGGKFDFVAFEKFAKETQKYTLSSDELKSVFNKYASPTSSESPNEPEGIFTLDAFTSFLSSVDNSAFAEQGQPVWQEMTHPISDYYISSSHNTYLVGHQLVGVSTIEGYIRALLHSCRSVELDIYDGDEEPVIFHGKTLTSKVSLRDVCNAIMKYGFVTSPYPVLISAEVHCGIPQQEKMVDIMKEVFGDSLIEAPVEGRPPLTRLPSPEDLKHKILLKAKNLYIVEQLANLQAKKTGEKAAKLAVLEADASSSESEDESSGSSGSGGVTKIWRKMRGKNPDAPAKPKLRMSFRLASLLVYTIGVKCHGINPEVDYAPEHIFSLSEVAANKQLKASMLQLIKHNTNHLVRIYPKGTRVNSTNFEPHRYWAAGCQVVAINWQTFDLGYVMNQAMFQRNGRSGYILKPDALRLLDKNLIANHSKGFLDVTIISAQQLPPARDSKGQEIYGKSIPDPFVEVTLLIPDWSRSPFLAETAKKQGAQYHAATDGTTTSATSARTVSLSTAVVKDNGFNPLWNEKLSIPFDCVGDMKELIFVKFAVRQSGEDDEDDEPLAIYCIPLGSLNQGYRHLPLHDSQMNQHLFSTLFVNISVRTVV
ncbi:1-phosphatidylinositol-4,5-bisphosphate phosphodiesterase 1 [Coprinopsis marcescibilis]|uniref:Phosphoinositide phospholipase C n=1 Tax=Coprinopsis marcescibilis TaxID=230819 RepID=A0A5C3KLI8_COPMA|nr:1-phosphatidylinositol-4,5-bisphosphate phosphodiesterase 1 [Coprinopsis marcescibilis]